jgi:predicted GIY-YIG superfamily endonuclease
VHLVGCNKGIYYIGIGSDIFKQKTAKHFPFH